jgi:hypothetical protein
MDRYWMPEKVIQMKQFVSQITTESTSTEPVPHDSVLAVVDTAKGKIDTATKYVAQNKLIVKKDYTKLNSAIDHFQDNYKKVELKRVPSTLEINQ